MRDIETGRDLPDILRWSKFSGANWSSDSKGFYYTRYAEPRSTDELSGANYYPKLSYHRIGDPQSSDKVIYERPDHKDWGFNAIPTEDGSYLVLVVGRAPNNIVFYQDLKTPGAKMVGLISEFEGSNQFLGNQAGRFYFLTNVEAPNRRVIAIDVSSPDRGNWREIIPEPKETIDQARIASGMLMLTYLGMPTARPSFTS